ncbi:BgTH12-00202 [Blumeria graminis f. sp. triticale]|uniref:Bgt-5365 n=3 Tax=Blumeria graminis TaxID=34373 RepID=A0A9X9QEX7_BLUGR|nr:Transcription cofactor [Blumeria graminis f. sp. tritici 96224]CAD6504696.1 BgTH12-00202 [Blumeria graminis f. sp. triticale]VDB92738.1 Bgt-5365 [Blumeria graminis f. sp. tritici]
MSFQVDQEPQTDELVTQSPGTFKQNDSANTSHHNNSPPQIYSAVYSTVDVYEMEVNGIAVMRRRKDSWLNATQILKVAGIDKGKRTKVLEKEILTGEHEKVQGGYGKYQGTWIKFEKGLDFCRQFGVEELLRPLLTYDMGQDGGIAGGGVLDTPTKEQAMAAQRKRQYYANIENRPNSQVGTLFKNISNSASHAVAAITKARLDSTVPRSRNGNSTRRTSLTRYSSQGSPSWTSGEIEHNTQSNLSPDQVDRSQEILIQPSIFGQTNYDDVNTEFEEPPRKRIRSSLSKNGTQISTQDDHLGILIQQTPNTETNGSSTESSQNKQQQNGVCLPLGPLEVPINPQTEEKKEHLMSLFTNYSQTDFSSHKTLQTFTPEELDIPIDGSRNTALIWAATLARVELLKNLKAHGANIFRVNSSGETALMRSCLVTNNLDMGSFPEILELLSPTIEIRDSKGRTVLHHIAIASAVKGRSQASKYYLESLLELVVRASSSYGNQQHSMGERQGPQIISIGRFMSDIVNIQDQSGDTALMIASRIGNKSIISQLLEVGADISIPNHSYLTPADFCVGDGVQFTIQGEHKPNNIPRPEPRESSKEIISSILSLLQETESEFAAEIERKQSNIDELHSKLRAESGALGQRRRLFESLQAEMHESDTRNLKIDNLRRACDEEQSLLSQIQQLHKNSGVENIDQIGDADKFLEIPSEAVDILTKIGKNEQPTLEVDPTERENLLAKIPTAEVLRARIDAYKIINEGLERNVLDLQGKDSELTRKYRKIIALCTGMDEERVEESIAGLVRSLESEHDDVELCRVREFLSRVGSV